VSPFADNEQLKAGHLYLDSSRIAAAKPVLSSREPGRVSVLGAKMNTVGRVLNATSYHGSLLYGAAMWFEETMPSWVLEVSHCCTSVSPVLNLSWHTLCRKDV
jgi:hypothetical protein